MITINQIKSLGRQILNLLNSYAEAIDRDPNDYTNERIRVLEQEIVTLRARYDDSTARRTA